MMIKIRSIQFTLILGLLMISIAVGSDSLSVVDQGKIDDLDAPDTLRMQSFPTTIIAGFDFLTEKNPDLLLEWARNMAIESKNFGLAIKIARQGLVIAPDYLDIRLLLGRLYAWNGQYDSARVELETVVNVKPDYDDARNALADALMWAGDYEEASNILEAGLEINPDNVDFRYKHAICALELGVSKIARKELKALLEVHPDHEKAAAVLLGMAPEPMERKVSVLYTLNRLADTQTQWQMLVGETSLDPWHMLSIEMEQKFDFGPVIARFNIADRYGRSGQQLEFESYPLLREGTYAYVGLGYSWTELFPKYRTGAEIFQALPNAFEVSLGYRSLHFENQDLKVLAGSLSKYQGDYWLSLRTFISPNEGSLSRSLNMQLRRYLKDADTYFELSLGQGETPGVGIGEDEINYLGSRRIGALCQWKVGHVHLVKGMISLANVEIRESAYRGDTGMGITYSRLF